jgi:hypothetical protein
MCLFKLSEMRFPGKYRAFHSSLCCYSLTVTMVIMMSILTHSLLPALSIYILLTFHLHLLSSLYLCSHHHHLCRVRDLIVKNALKKEKEKVQINNEDSTTTPHMYDHTMSSTEEGKLNFRITEDCPAGVPKIAVIAALAR